MMEPGSQLNSGCQGSGWTWGLVRSYFHITFHITISENEHFCSNFSLIAIKWGFLEQAHSSASHYCVLSGIYNWDPIYTYSLQVGVVLISVRLVKFYGPWLF